MKMIEKILWCIAATPAILIMPCVFCDKLLFECKCED